MTDTAVLERPARTVNAIAMRVRASQIDPDPRNPRKFIDPTELDEMAGSISRRGLLQPILIRPSTNGRYMIVFGERRWRGFVIAMGADAEMPVLLCDLTDEEALYAQIDENEIRVATSETEDAAAAARVLADCNNDRAEAIARLGWSASKFDRRLALTKLSPTIQKALNERIIKLGHAELLAAVPADKQDKALETILSAKIDVAGARDLLARMSHQLAAATFDKTECAACPFNSTLQRTLFETAVDDGACTNPTCYQLKTAQAKQAADAAKAASPASTEKPPRKPAAAPRPTATSLPTTEETAPVSSENHPADPPASAAHADAAAPAEPANDAPVAASQPDEPPADEPSFKAARSSCRHKALRVREAIWRRALAKHLAETPDHARLVVVAAGFSATLSELSRQTLPSRAAQLIAPDFSTKSPAEQFAAVAALDPAALERAHCAIAAAYAIDVPDFDRVEALASACKVDIRPLWRVDKSFLDLYTKDELKFIAFESGLVDIIGAKPFSKLAAGKRDDLVKAMATPADFDWSGRLPSAMTLDGRYGPPSAA
jgi:ParB/RepB/Spo0J family partition protein